MKKRVCVISEDLSHPVDEGIKHFARSIIESWPQECDVMGLSVRVKLAEKNGRFDSLSVNRLFLSPRLYQRIRRFHPDLICYVPSASATVFSFLRSKILKFACRSSRVVMVSLQPRHYDRLSQRLLPWLSPDIVFVQSEEAMAQLQRLGCRTAMIPSGVDTEKFVPVTQEKKTALRLQYGLDVNTFTVLHVGHTTAGRNIEFLINVRRDLNAQVIFVGSHLSHADRVTLTSRLRDNGVIVLDGYFPHIEELYQLADCYLFPVFSDRACIGVPLSVLEAMACNLPVVSVRYGNLPRMFEEGQGLTYADTPEGLLLGLKMARNTNGCHTREKVAGYSWQQIARYILVESMKNGAKN